MKIAVNGGGNVGAAPGTAAVAAGHPVRFTAEDPVHATARGWVRQSACKLVGAKTAQ
jgi:predicted dinucleotide-binding enzyme